MLSLSKHSGSGLYARTLRQAQGDNALLSDGKMVVLERLTKFLKLRKSVRFLKGDNAILYGGKTGVMLSLSKYSGPGLSAHTLRQAQGDNALLFDGKMVVLERLTKFLKLRKSDRFLKGDNALLFGEKTGVMLSLSKHGRAGFSAHILQGGKIFCSLLTILFCLFLSVDTSAQSVKKEKTDTSKNVYTIHDVRSITTDQPLYIIDGKLIPDSLSGSVMKSLNKNNIFDISILMNYESAALYGARGANGAIIIRTKAFQKADTAKVSNALNSIDDKNTLYLINGQPSNNKLNDINPNDIISIDILKKGKGSDATFEPVNDIVVVVTKANAVKQYQKKFSSFSNQYREFLNQHHNDDNNITYIVDGVILNDDKERIIKLYKLPVTEIENFGFNNEKPMDSKILATVIINTKK